MATDKQTPGAESTRTLSIDVAQYRQEPDMYGFSTEIGGLRVVGGGASRDRLIVEVLALTNPERKLLGRVAIYRHTDTSHWQGAEALAQIIIDNYHRYSSLTVNDSESPKVQFESSPEA